MLMRECAMALFTQRYGAENACEVLRGCIALAKDVAGVLSLLRHYGH